MVERWPTVTCSARCTMGYTDGGSASRSVIFHFNRSVMFAYLGWLWLLLGVCVGLSVGCVCCVCMCVCVCVLLLLLFCVVFVCVCVCVCVCESVCVNNITCQPVLPAQLE